MRILIFVVAYNAEQHIVETLERIPRPWLDTIDYEILIINDASTDRTEQILSQYLKGAPELLAHSMVNVINLGYGGNQKKGYEYAKRHNFDIVVLLHGDGQYAPEHLPQMITPIYEGRADVILGSRMIKKIDALRGKMPFYKWIGNQVLTFIQNLLLGTNLSEFHTGYRAFKVNSLRAIPLEHNSDYFDFDTEIIIQLVDTKARFEEISIPTFYGNEISYVNGFKYAWLIIKSTLKSRWVKMGWIEDVRFDYK